MQPQDQFPAGLVDKSTEVFYTNGELFAIHNGKRTLFTQLPKSIKTPFITEFRLDLTAQKALRAHGIHNPFEQFKHYIKCKYGGFNNTPDCNEAGELEAEHWKCHCGGHCPIISQTRGRIAVLNGELTDREIEVCVRIAEGDPGKSIAYKMSITEATLNTHKQRIFRKTGFQSNLEIAKWVTINKIGHHAIK